jgi:hypothetical protein
MNAYMKKAVYFAMLLGTFALVLGSTGCAGTGHRPGWIFPTRQ